jgi:hypothetical protein
MNRYYYASLPHRYIRFGRYQNDAEAMNALRVHNGQQKRFGAGFAIQKLFRGEGPNFIEVLHFSPARS